MSRFGERGTARLTSDQVVRILRHHGFLRIGTSGSHQKWRHPFTGRAIVDGSGIEPLEWLN
jgi:predicted RNA binding protein YcfA (HicA-like mRNA interferase family)